MNITETIVIAIMSSFIGGFISYYFTEKTENYKFQLFKKEQAAKIAELFALWMKCDDETLEKFSKEERLNHCEKLNKLTWELAIWINDEEIVKKIMERLSHNSQSDIKEIILEIREQIQNKKTGKFKWDDIVFFK